MAHTRELILRSALTTFLERGFEGTHMVDVAARAGLAKGTPYLHFADKEALFEFVLQQLISEPLSRLRMEPPTPGETLRARLDRQLLPLLRDFDPKVLRLVIAEGARFPALADIHRRLVIIPIMKVVAEAIGSLPDNRLEALRRFPQLMGAPVIMSSVWNELWGRHDKVEPHDMLVAFLDLVIGSI